MRARVKVLSVGFLVAALPALAQTAARPKPVTGMPGSVAKQIAGMIRASGFECPELRAAYHMGSDDYGQIMRAVCGRSGGGAIDDPTFRVLIGHSWQGIWVSRWEEPPAAVK
jgi:hypothetical protein